MYTSLDRIDVVAETADQRPLYVLTDHRDADEQALDLPLSIVFALSRVLLCQRHARSHGDDAEIRMAFLAGAHPDVARAVAAAGGHVEVDGVSLPPESSDTDPWLLLDEAMAALARDVVREEGVTADEAGLRRLEREVWAFGFDRDDDEIGYFTWLVKLAAVTGEILRCGIGGRWEADHQDFSFLPYTWRGEDGCNTNVLGRCIRLLAHGPEQGPSVLLQVRADRDVEAGPLLVNFKPADFGGLGLILHEPLLRRSDVAGMVMVTYGYDRPNTFQYMVPDSEEAGDLDALRAEAARNLAAIEPGIEPIDLDGVTVVVVSGDYYASEKLLDVPFLQRMHDELGAETLLASVPAKGMLLLMDAAPENHPVFFAITEGRYADASREGQEISALPFLVHDGAVIGFARVTRDPVSPKAEKPGKGLFSWLFRGEA